MIVPAIGGLAGGLSERLANGVSGQAGAAPAASAQSSAGVEGTSGAGGVEGTSGVESGAAGSGGFGSQLSEAISSLEGTQLSASSAAQSLATGTAKDPESAVVTVEDAQMAMDLAAQLRTKAAEAAQSIFQTQV